MKPFINKVVAICLLLFTAIRSAAKPTLATTKRMGMLSCASVMQENRRGSMPKWSGSQRVSQISSAKTLTRIRV